ncbi:hypothetical protein D3C73_1084770 [compost metagenome]
MKLPCTADLAEHGDLGVHRRQQRFRARKRLVDLSAGQFERLLRLQHQGVVRRALDAPLLQRLLELVLQLLLTLGGFGQRSSHGRGGHRRLLVVALGRLRVGLAVLGAGTLSSSRALARFGEALLSGGQLGLQPDVLAALFDVLLYLRVVTLGEVDAAGLGFLEPVGHIQLCDFTRALAYARELAWQRLHGRCNALTSSPSRVT